MNINIKENDYINYWNKIKETIKHNQYKAMVQVNSEMIKTYYEIGSIINERKTWGNKYIDIERLSFDLKELGKGYSTRNLKFMSQLSSTFDINKFGKQPVAQIPWRTIVTIIKKVKLIIKCYFI